MAPSVLRRSGSLCGALATLSCSAGCSPRARYHWRSARASGRSGSSAKEVESNPESERPPKSLTTALWVSGERETHLDGDDGVVGETVVGDHRVLPEDGEVDGLRWSEREVPTALLLSTSENCLRFISLPLRERNSVTGSCASTTASTSTDWCGASFATSAIGVNA